MRSLIFLLGLQACIIVPVPIPVPTMSQAPVRNLSTSTAPDTSFHAQLNAVRRQPIAFNAQLSAVARRHAADMQARGYFDHVSPEGARSQDRAAAAGISNCGIGENIAQGQKSWTEVFTAWMNSGGHRRNMLNPRMASYGLGQAGDYWVLMLYTPC